MADPTVAPPLVAGELLRERRRSRQWQLLVRNSEREAVTRLSEHEAVENVDVRTPSLEEIFVAYLQHDNSSAANEVEPSSLRGVAT